MPAPRRQFWQGFQEFCGPNLPLQTLFNFVVDALRAGDAYQWAERAAFTYNAYFIPVLEGLNHDITVFNPEDDLYEMTPKILPYLNKGRLLDKPEWEHGFFDVHTQDAVTSILQAIDTKIHS